MKSLFVAVPLAVATGILIGVRPETPWFSARVDRVVNFAGTTGAIASGSSFVVTQVPATQTLILSEVWLAPLQGNTPCWTLVQRDATGVETVRLTRVLFGSSGNDRHHVDQPGLGFVFEPGCEVVLKYTNPSGGGIGEAEFVFVGHLRDR